MGRLDSELWRCKLRGSLIRHLPLHTAMTRMGEGKLHPLISIFVCYFQVMIGESGVGCTYLSLFTLMAFSRFLWLAERSLIHQCKAQSFVYKLCMQYFIFAFTVCLVLLVEWTYFFWYNIPHQWGWVASHGGATCINFIGYCFSF